MRTKKALYNSMFNLLHQVIVAIAGLILPRLILSRFGSDYNGITSSITQFISYISLFTAGIGEVTRTALYKPLVDQDTMKISGIVRATELFMRKVALGFAVGLAVFATLYPLLIQNEFDWSFSFTLVLILGFGTFIQYFFGISYHMLLAADQRDYIHTLINIGTTILNTLIAAALILAGGEFRLVKLTSALVFAINPIFLYWYVRKHYNLPPRVNPDTSAIKQRWDAFAHQLAAFAQNNTDIVIITVFLGVKEVSVYAVYFLVIRNIKVIILSVVGSGIISAFGNMMAKNEQGAVKKNLRLYEFLTNSLSVVFWTSTALLIVPFVSVYTEGVHDADYFRPAFAYITCIAQFLFVFRIPYQNLVQAAGHFKQTRNGAIAEVCINIILSIILVQWFGLIGVTIGTLCAMIFRTMQYSIYMSRHIVRRSIWVVVRKLLLSALNAALIVAIVQLLPDMNGSTYIAWIFHALPVLGIASGVTALFAALFYREDMQMLIGKLVLAIRRRK